MDTSKHTPAYIIFHYLFEVYIPQHFLYSDEYITQFGLPTSGDALVDRNLAESMVLTQRSIADIAVLLSEGAKITLKDPTKSELIYKTIIQHLQDWEVKTRRSLITDPPPIEDLEQLNDLAQEIRPLADAYMVTDVPESKLGLSLAKLGLGLTKPVTERAKIKVDLETVSDVSTGDKMLDFISKEIYARGQQ